MKMVCVELERAGAAPDFLSDLLGLVRQVQTDRSPAEANASVEALKAVMLRHLEEYRRIPAAEKQE